MKIQKKFIVTEEKFERELFGNFDENIKLIEENTYHSWQQLYSKFEDFDEEDLPGDFGKCMLDAGINPCEVLGYVPRRFL